MCRAFILDGLVLLVSFLFDHAWFVFIPQQIAQVEGPIHETLVVIS